MKTPEGPYINRKIIPESAKGYFEYAETFAKDSAEFDQFLEDADVLDIGSGIAKFAIDVALRKLRDPKYRGPKSVYSLNVRYRNPAYLAVWLRAGGADVLKKEKADRQALRQALETVRAHCLPTDWNNLDELRKKGMTFDRIISRTGFPYFSDIVLGKKGSGQETMGPRSKKIFSEIKLLLREGGIAEFETNWEAQDWEILSDAYKQDLFAFFDSIQIDAEIFPSRQGEDVTYILSLKHKK